MFIGRTDVEAETPILWPPDAKSWLFWKDPDAGKDWGQEEKEMTEDEMVGWHHQLSGHEFGWTPGIGYGQWGLACCDSWGCRESDTTEWLNWTELKDCAPRLHYCSLAAPLLSLYPLPSLVSNGLNLLFGTLGRSWRVNRKVPAPRSPTGSCLFS